MKHIYCFTLWTVLISNLLMYGCTKDSFEPVYDVHPDFEYLIDSFKVEAARNGVSLEIKNLQLNFGNNLPVDICAECNSLQDIEEVQKVITINEKFKCWENSWELEALIFHELGHCILRRDHNTETLPNGDPKSLMVEGNILVFAPCRYVFGPDASECNNLFKRDYYIQELFNPETPIPEWSK